MFGTSRASGADSSLRQLSDLFQRLLVGCQTCEWQKRRFDVLNFFAWKNAQKRRGFQLSSFTSQQVTPLAESCHLLSSLIFRTASSKLLGQVWLVLLQSSAKRFESVLSQSLEAVQQIPGRFPAVGPRHMLIFATLEDVLHDSLCDETIDDTNNRRAYSAYDLVTVLVEHFSISLLHGTFHAANSLGLFSTHVD